MGHAADPARERRLARSRSRSEVAKSIGHVSKAALKPLKRGVQLALRDAVVRAQRVQTMIGGPVQQLQEVLESQTLDWLFDVARGEKSDALIGEACFPKPMNRYQQHHLPLPSLIGRLPRYRPQVEDEWPAGHLDGWIYREHFSPRERDYVPGGVTVPRWFPLTAFTGERETRVYRDGHEVLRHRTEDFRASGRDVHFRLDEPWVGFTFFRIRDEWLDRHYSGFYDVDFDAEVRALAVEASDGTYPLSNGDTVYVAHRAVRARGVLPCGPSTPVSTFASFVPGQWMTLEYLIPHKDRATHRVKEGHLVTEAVKLIQIHHESLVPPDDSQGTLVGELYTSTEPVSRMALRMGHRVKPRLSLITGYDFKYVDDCKRAVAELEDGGRPFLLVLAFPCGAWSALSNLTVGKDVRKKLQRDLRRGQETVLVDFAAEQAVAQLMAGKHFAVVNPKTLAAWSSVGKLKTLVEQAAGGRLHRVDVDQCAFGLLGPGGGPHKKSTTILTSSPCVADGGVDRWPMSS